MGKIEGAPKWILKYKEGIEKGTIAMEDILEMENKIREKQIKIVTVSRAINAAGYQIIGLKSKKKGEREFVKEKEKEVAYTGSIGEISKETEKRYMEMKESWEKDLEKSLHNDYFLNILLALAKLVERKKTLKMKEK